jgi:hypothetical protein
MVKVKCAKCEAIKEVDKLPKKFICLECGALNTPVPEITTSSDQACGCLLPTGFEWKLPTGEFGTPLGMMYSTADDGTWLTRLEWIEIFGFDPKIAKEYMQKLGIEGKPGYTNLSTLGKKRAK